jgi:hypothetical protein
MEAVELWGEGLPVTAQSQIVITREILVTVVGF